ncbi:MAG: hypothetical protein JWN70_477, partial [Planctomycetaceae bacterium]|nr:hypothetical protein [Planctomycetaceae bacterium]
MDFVVRLSESGALIDEDNPTQGVGLRKGPQHMANTIPLSEIAHARSGDKGNHANVGVIA